MKTRFDILRRQDAASEPYHQLIDFEYEDENLSVALALAAINETADFRDVEGELVGEIRWQCSCLQKKCGSCAMVVEGLPRVACDTKLRDFTSGIIHLEPLRKFPVIADLLVDRAAMRENLLALEAWLKDDAQMDEDNMMPVYDASRCLQCGCCLDVCPNFYIGGSFAGAASTAEASRLIPIVPAQQKRGLHKNYRKHIYEGCGKSLACRDICPVELPIEEMLVRSNAAAVWRRGRYR